MQDVMIDLETLDTRPSTVILSVGAVRFDLEQPDVIGDTFHVHIDIDTCLAAGRTVSGSTLLWWLDQDDDARKKISCADRVPLRDALLSLSTFIGPKDRVWGNGAGFDNVILSDAYRSLNLEQPWRYWGDMCYRTLKNLYRHVPRPELVGVAHDALDDAVFQARHLQLIYQRIKEQTPIAA